MVPGSGRWGVCMDLLSFLFTMSPIFKLGAETHTQKDLGALAIIDTTGELIDRLRLITRGGIVGLKLECRHKLAYYITKMAERATGVEPASPPWKGGIIPLYHARTHSF